MELDAPNVGELEKKYLVKAIESGFVSTFGGNVPEFEEKFAAYVGAKKAVATQSGTAALHMALHELGIGKNDEVIVPALTFVATANPVVYVGAKPVFVDVDIRTWNIAADKIEEKITKRTKAIIPVHFYGNPCDMDAIMDIARKHSLYVIEDATESLGARYKKRYTGTLGVFGCFSFNGNKVITTGGGGMVVGDDEKALGHINFLVNQGRDAASGFYHPEVGFNYRMTNIEAALGLAQMERVEEFLAKKRAFNAIYKSELKGLDPIIFQEGYDGADSSFWFTCVRFKDGIDPALIQKRLKEKKVPTRRVFMPIVEFPPYKEGSRKGYENSHKIFEGGLCLPSSTVNSEKDIYYACGQIKKIIGG